MNDAEMALLEVEVLEAVRAERAIELGSRGKPWDDDDVWAAYLRARHVRQRAVDAWMKAQPVSAEAMVERLIEIGL